MAPLELEAGERTELPEEPKKMPYGLPEAGEKPAEMME
jgi:hypothetical protein